nr:retrovirus-related Pol polyprotein from transposon TNT 1-94 [Tanacetum cinerariifolium]
MHNNIMAAGSKDRPPMLAPGRYPQWRSQFLRYVDIRPNSEALRKCILSSPYKPTTVLVHAVEATDNSPAVPEHTIVETPANMSLKKAHFLAEKEAIHLMLTGIRDDIYSTVDACQTTQEMWEAIDRVQQGQRSISSTTLAGMVKQYQNEVNELHAEKLARNANPLALVATAQASQDPFYQSSRSNRSQAPSPKPSIPSRSHTSTRHKGKEIAKPITPPSEIASEEDSDPEQAQRDKDMQKNLALIAKYFKKIYKPTNNNLRTSSNSKNKNVDTTLRYKNDDHSGQFETQRTVNVAGTREKVRSQVVQKTGIQCFNCKEYGHFTKECRKPKRVKDSAYHKEKMLLCNQVEQGVPLQAEQYDWLADRDEEVDEQELEAHYSYIAKIQEVPNATQAPILSQWNRNVIPDSPDMCEDDIQNDQNDVESDDERVALANLIANSKLDVDENKKIQKQLKKANTSLAQELKECKAILAETNALAELQCMYLHKVKECDCLAQKIVQLILFIVDSRCTKHMTGNLKLLCNFVEKLLGTVRFDNDQFATILGYGDLVQGNVTINRVYYVEGLNHNLFSFGQFYDADLEVAFRKSTCFVRDLQGNDLLTGKRRSDLYTISIQESTSSTPLCLMANAIPTQAWLWHRRLSHLNFDYINLLSKKDIVIGLPKLKYVKDQLCSSCELSKAKRSSFKSKAIPSSKGRLHLLHMDLCGPMRVASINGKKYILVIVDDYSRYTWTLFLRSKDETLKVLKDFLTMIQRNLQALVITVRTDKGTEFLNKTLNAFFKEEGIEHQTSTAQIPEQNGVVKRRNRTLVEAARMMLSALQLPLFFWAEAIATACYTQN